MTLNNPVYFCIQPAVKKDHFKMKLIPLSKFSPRETLHAIIAIIPSLCLASPLSAETTPPSKLAFEQYPAYFSSYSNPLTPSPGILLRFNAPVTVDQASVNIHFSSKDSSGLKIPASVQRPSEKEALKLQPYPKDPKQGQNFPLTHFVDVRPLTPLPTDHQWNLVIAKGFASSDRKTVASSELTSDLGRLDSFKLNQAQASNPYDAKRSIQLYFNKKLHQGITAENLSQYIKITPQPSGLSFHSHHYGIGIDGEFHYGQKYVVTVGAGLPAADQTIFPSALQQTLVFSPNAPFVHLPAFSTAQNLSGERKFSIVVGNTKSTTVRIKELQGKDLIYALRGYEAYHKRSNGIPFEMVPGRTVFDKTWLQNSEMDHSEKFDLSWDSLQKDKEPGAYYLCAEADSKHLEDVGSQALVQLTDIGLAWKKSSQQTLLYAFSHRSGQALPGASITLFDNDATALRQHQTNQEGLATIDLSDAESKNGARWLEIRFAKDRHVLAIDGDMDTLGLWRFDVPYRYDRDDDQGLHRRSMIFTDRPVYKPGETVHLKCLTRLTDDKQLLPPSADQPSAKLTVFDSQQRTILSRTVALSKYGSIDQDIVLPDNTLGHFQVEIDFNPDPDSNEQNWRNLFGHSFLVAEYRPNTFEIELASQDHYQLPAKVEDKITIPVAAKYFMGKALSSAQLRWHAIGYPRFPDSKEFADFSFGDTTQNNASSISLSDSLDLSAEGTGDIHLSLPTATQHPLPVELDLSTEITDINQQTVATSSSFMVHSSDFYLGTQVPAETLRAGKAFPLSLASIGQDGKPYPQAVSAEIKVERIIWNTVKVRGAGGTISHRNESRQVPVMEEKLAVVMGTHPETGTVIPPSTQLQLDQGGEYLLTLSARDSSGRSVVTRSKIQIYGGDETPSWSRHDGTRIDVVPDKESYTAGETAKLLVKTPVTGHALVTVEREGIRRSFTRQISKQQSVIDIPVEAMDAPNVFVSVLIVRGLEDSPHQHPDTEYRLGYAQVTVADPSAELSVKLSTPPGTIEPGQAVELTALVSDHLQQPVANTEVTLYAVDEGVLSLTGYATPAPADVFNAPYPLSVYTGQSVSALLPENPNDLDFGNKGYVIGGGGEGEGGMARIRKNFKALAYWNGSLITDHEGKVKASFPAPDSLTEYRVIAVANTGSRFASAADKFVVQKPLILEPSLPVFGNVGDQIDLTAVLHNNTEKALDLEVAVKLDSTAKFLKPQSAIIRTSTSGKPAAGDGDLSQTRTLHVAAGKTSSLSFPAVFTQVGEAKWMWTARALNDDTLIDRVESSLPIGYPLPLLRHAQRFSLHQEKSQNPFQLLESVDPKLLKGQGDIRVTFSNSRMIEALDAVDYLLTYPYGCLEQTTSSTLPWLSTQNLRQAMPSLNRSPKEISQAISHGAKRLLSMQTRDGGLSYWPGASESILWGSAYGGMVLALAEKAEVDLPEDSLQDLWKYLSSNLRNSGKITDAYSLSQRCLASYTLALAGHPEPGYHDLLFEKRQQLPLEARALLALAMLESDSSPSNKDRARILLTQQDTKTPNSEVAWYGEAYTFATQLLAWSKIAPQGDQVDVLAEKLLKLKHGPRAWGSTYNNAWPLLALSQHSLAVPALKAGQTFQIEFDGKIQSAKFDQDLASLEFHFPFKADRPGLPLQVTTTPGAHLYAQVEVATQPDLLPFEPQDKGFSIRRNYQRIQNDGALAPAENLTIGDLILVTLHTTIAGREHYLAIEDRLPAIFEAINPSFKSQGNESSGHGKWKRLWPNHTEIRKDRVLFFQDYLYQGGEYTIQYLARVVAPGSATAPPAKIESMYEPQRYGLSATKRLSASPMKTPNKADSPIAVR
jgi:uncharacterized protein YfaS (alpha-2-macroglobulin family)